MTSERWTKEKIFSKLDWEGGTWEGICGYGIDVSVLPEDAPERVKLAWQRVQASKDDVWIINDWLEDGNP
jgi:hypothetical protein